MSAALCYAVTGCMLFALGLAATVLLADSLRRVLAFNVMGSGAFLVFVGAAQRDGVPDPVPQAMVLTGIVVNDSLVLVDHINHRLKSRGEFWRDAVINGAVRRFRPVVLTSVTTFVGLLPIQLETSLQAQFVKPMAVSVAFGVLFATFVTLVLVPVLYFIGRDIQALFGRGHQPEVIEAS